MIHMLRNGLYGLTALFLSCPIMWSLPAATMIPAFKYDRSGKKYRIPACPKTFSSAGASLYSHCDCVSASSPIFFILAIASGL